MMKRSKRQRQARKKRIAAYLLMIAMLVNLLPGDAFVTYATENDGNLITNGDFETPGTASTDPVNVDAGDSSGALFGTELKASGGTAGKDGSLKFEYVTVEGYDGQDTHAMQISRTDSETKTARKNLIATASTANMKAANSAFKLSVRLKAVGVTDDNFKIDIRYQTTVKNPAVDTTDRDVSTYFVQGKAAKELTEWTEFSVVIPKEEAAYVKNDFRFNMYLYGMTDGSLLMDDLKLVPWTAVNSVTLSHHLTYVETGDELSLAAAISPEDASDKTVIYTSSNEAVATVDENGKVTALAEGETVITATAPNEGIKDSCTVVVVDEYVSLDAISIDGDFGLFTGGQKQLTVNFEPANTTAKKIIWSSSDETVATVTQDGLVTALKAGTATITAEGENSKSAACVVTVTESASLSATEANLTADFGALLEGNFASYVTNNTGEALSFTLYQETTNGTIKVNADGTFTYLPKVYDAEGTIKYLPTADVNADGEDDFRVFVTAGNQTTLLTGKITLNSVGKNAETNLTSDLTLLVSEEKIEEIKALIANGDPTTIKLWNNLKAEADRIMSLTIPSYEDHEPADSANKGDSAYDQNVYGDWIRGVADRIPNLLFAALLSPDETEAAAYKAKCIEYIEAVVVDYPYWGELGGEDGGGGVYGEGHLAAGHAAFATAVAASWLYDDLTPELKMSVHQRMYKVCVVMDYIWREHANIIGNHMWNAFSGMSAASMLMYAHSDEAFAAISALDPDKVKYELGLTINQEKSVEELEASCVEWFDLICDQIGVAFELLPADGANHEGSMYHTYGLEDLLKIVLLMDNNLDVDMFTGNSWLEKSIDYFLNIIVPVESLDGTQVLMRYGNAHKYIEYGASPLMRVLASYYRNGTAQWVAEKLEDAGADPVSESLLGTCFWMSVLYADTDLQADDPTDRSTLYYGDDLGIVVSRTNWTGNEAMVFMRAGIPLGKRNQANMIAGLVEIGHSCGDHQDIDCNAIRLFYNEEELLRENGYKASKSTGSQSTLLVAGNGQLGDGSGAQSSVRYEELQASPEITKTETTDLYDYFVGDATEAYEPELGLAKFARHTVLIKEANVLLVVDDIKAIQDTELELRWFPESKSVLELNAYGYYTVSSTKNEMRFYPLTTEGVTTTFGDVEYLQYHSEVVTTEKAFSQQAVTSSWQNAVAFTWGSQGSTQPYVYYEKGDAGEHKFEVDGKIYTVDVNSQTVTMDEVTVTVTGEGADIADGYMTKVGLNEPYILTVEPQDGYVYTVTATMGGDQVELTPNAEKTTYTIESVTGPLVFTVDRVIDIQYVLVTDMRALDEQMVFAVRFTMTLPGGHVPTYNGEKMYWSENHNEYIYLVIGTELSAENARGLVGSVEGTADIVVDSYDVNGSGSVDASDAQYVWNMCNAQYSEFTDDVTMADFICADRNGNWEIDVSDAAWIVNEILGIQEESQN